MITAEDLGFEAPDLASATISEELHAPELERYATFEHIAECLRNLPPRKRRVSRRKLSANGKVVADNMDHYLAMSAYEPSSALKEMLKTPAHYRAYKDPDNKRTGDHFSLGTFCHSAILEPRKFDRVHVEPKVSLNTKEGVIELVGWYTGKVGLPETDLSSMSITDLRARLTALREYFTASGFAAVTAEHDRIISTVKRSFTSYGGGALARMMKLVDSEVSFYATDPETGVKVRIRPDGLMLEENFGFNGVLSVKTTSAESLEAFRRDALKYKYDLAEGMYLEVASLVTGRKFSATLMLVVQTIPPYQIMLLHWAPEDLESGRLKYRKALSTLKECRESNEFPGFETLSQEASGLISFDLPEYSRWTAENNNNLNS